MRTTHSSWSLLQPCPAALASRDAAFAGSRCHSLRVPRTLRTAAVDKQCVCGIRREASKPVARPQPKIDKDLGFAKPDEEVGFRYDAANLRWVRDSKYSEKFWNPTVTPLTGGTYMVWPAVHTALIRKGLKSISTEQAFQLQQKGAVLVDVRVARNFADQHIAGAVSLPLYRPVQGSTWIDNVKRLAVGAMAMEATERDPDFRNTALQQLDKKKKLIVYCGLGGTLHVGVKPWAPGRRAYNDPERAFGRESRSLKACYELVEAGFKDVVHLEGGINQWRYDGYPVES